MLYVILFIDFHIRTVTFKEIDLVRDVVYPIVPILISLNDSIGSILIVYGVYYLGDSIRPHEIVVKPQIPIPVMSLYDKRRRLREIIHWFHRKRITIKVYSTVFVDKDNPQNVTENLYRPYFVSIYAFLVSYVRKIDRSLVM